MNSLGLNLGFLIVQFLNIGLLLLWPALSLVALFALRRRGLAGTALAVWALIIVAVPVLGAAAFFILQPGQDPPA